MIEYKLSLSQKGIIVTALDNPNPEKPAAVAPGNKAESGNTLQAAM